MNLVDMYTYAYTLKYTNSKDRWLSLARPPVSQRRLGDSLARPWLRDGGEKVKNMKNMKN